MATDKNLMRTAAQGSYFWCTGILGEAIFQREMSPVGGSSEEAGLGRGQYLVRFPLRAQVCFTLENHKHVRLMVTDDKKALFLVTDEPLPRLPAGPVFLVHWNPFQEAIFQREMSLVGGGLEGARAGKRAVVGSIPGACAGVVDGDM